MPKILKFLTVSLLLLACTIGIAGYKLRDWYDNSKELDKAYTFSYEQGMSSKDLAEQLADKGIISNAAAYRVGIRLFSDYRKFKAGLYQFKGQVSPKKIANIFSEGKTYNVVVLDVIIPEGFTLKQIARRLEAKQVGLYSDIMLITQDKVFLKELGIPATTLEGYLYPATYTFHNQLPTVKEALTRMVKEFFKRLPSDYIRKSRLKGIGLNEAVIFASLIEMETLHADERSLVSEVIWRRLNNGAPIGIDAAIIYGIHDYDGDIKTVHLKDKSNPYNTRIHKGLPPTAIGSPSIASLNAVLTPANKKNYYYVLKPGKDQRHHFSKSLREHNKHVKRLVRSYRR